ncbi:MAG: hypothetical protein K0S56_4757, partial [Microvirga sp.]|nr:hypothetical protein [Microvirga sp.]
MSLGRWVLGAVAGAVLGAAGAQAAPLPLVPMDGQRSVQTVQFFFDDEPPPVYYDPPPRPYYRDYYPPPRRDYYPPPPRAYYAPPPGRYAPPPPRYAQPRQPPRNNQVAPQQLYTKGQVRAWNRANG